MSREGSPLDLNHLPEDFTRDGKHDFEDTSTSGQRRKKNTGKDVSGKVYECRFCSLKFCKSQALGGHMNRHRQERETETLNKARQLVYNSDQNLAGHRLPSLGSYVSPVCPPPSSHHQLYPTRPLMYSGAGSTVIQTPYQQYSHQSHVYTSSTRHMAHVHALPGSSHLYNDAGTNYNFIGAPAGIRGLGPGGRDGLDRDERGPLTGPWARSYVTSSSIGSDQQQ